MDNAPGVRFVSLTFLVGFGFGAFIGVALALIAVAVARPQDQQPQFIEVPVLPSPTPLPGETPAPQVRATAALAVRVGPGDAFATVGTIGRGDPLEVVGRDFDSEWLAIEFPPGSNAQGWIPAADVEGLTLPNLQALAVLLPTPLPIEFSTPSPFLGTPGTPGTGTPEVEDGTPALFPGTSDLAILDVRALPDGRVTILVLNAGPADLTGDLITVTVRSLGSKFENLTYVGDLAAGAIQGFTTTSFQIGLTAEDVQVVVDPSSSLADPNRLNNVLTTALSRPESSLPAAATAGPG